MRKFYLERSEDVSGTSGTGRVAEGVIFSNGSCAMSWLTSTSSVAFYQSIQDVETIHGHQGRTRVVYDEVEELTPMELQVSSYALDSWADQLGSPVKAQLLHGDWSEDYQVDAAHLFLLENGKYAVVTESGCSCYDYSDADITVYNNLAEAQAAFPEKKYG